MVMQKLERIDELEMFYSETGDKAYIYKALVVLGELKAYLLSEVMKGKSYNMNPNVIYKRLISCL